MKKTLTQSKAKKAYVCFTSASTQNKENGVHLSFEDKDGHTNLFISTGDALKMYEGLEQSLISLFGENTGKVKGFSALVSRWACCIEVVKLPHKTLADVLDYFGSCIKKIGVCTRDRLLQVCYNGEPVWNCMFGKIGPYYNCP